MEQAEIRLRKIAYYRLKKQLNTAEEQKALKLLLLNEVNSENHKNAVKLLLAIEKQGNVNMISQVLNFIK